MQSGGLRTKGFIKQSQENTPLITVVTVVYNGAETLEETILSVINQTYKNIEYIIVDGASTDTTLNIIKKYEDKIDYWISEHDEGIYDAMNKGLGLANGEWIIFMNSGDYFYTQNVIYDFIECKPETNKNYYGDSVYFTNNIIFKAISNLKSKWRFLYHYTFSHQAIFYSLNIIKETANYKLGLRVSSDFDLTFRLVKKSAFVKINKIISACNAEGFSSVNALYSYFDRMRSFKDNREPLFLILLIFNFPLFFIKRKIAAIIRNRKIHTIYRMFKYRQIVRFQIPSKWENVNDS
jgi:glycosyltransferase involved in cell wall biosynthesis